MQVRFAIDLTSEEYVSQRAWQKASLDQCPRHPEGGCGMHRHGTYERVEPPGTRIARWYCRRSQTTFGLLPDCLASHLSGPLAEVEATVDAASRGSSLESTSETFRPDIELPGAVRWIRRRIRIVRELFTTLIGLMPTAFASCQPTLASLRAALGTDNVLVTLREVAAEYLAHLPVPVGFAHRVAGVYGLRKRSQQRMGPDPPSDPSNGD